MVLLHNIHAHLWRIQNRIYKWICSRCFCLPHSIKNNSRIFLYVLFFSFFILIGTQLCRKRGSSTVVLLWILQFFKNTFFREHLRTNASDYRKNMPRTFKTKCEKNESDNTLITNIYILMISTYTKLNCNISIQTPCKHKAKLIAVTTWYRHKYRYKILDAVHKFNIVTNIWYEM